MNKFFSALILTAVAVMIGVPTTASACENQWRALERLCPPENPTPPGGNTCWGCAIAIYNCNRHCGIACDDYDDYYPPPGEKQGDHLCPYPWKRYISCSVDSSESMTMCGTDMGATCEVENSDGFETLLAK